ncbi:hypothetical protein CC86DRAFT_415989 [Ophiobolus disseminans]|uniref:Uncharacterized protein n=1 Tax=Ophiobolus disseminans TaxID=1469910 RepID=A0A6A7ALZ0_9PLEO|nr:hypothetical protein CC86DRAFT_415989 [Ophiobolus disseminans]
MGYPGSEYFDPDHPLMWNEGRDGTAEYAEAAVEMYIFASAYQIPRLRQDAMDRLVWCHNHFATEQSDQYSTNYVSPQILVSACQNTRPGSPLRELLLEGFYEFSDRADDTFKAIFKNVLVDVSRMISDHRGSIYGYWKPCDYHEHEDQEERERCKVRVDMEWEREEDEMY